MLCSRRSKCLLSTHCRASSSRTGHKLPSRLACLRQVRCSATVQELPLPDGSLGLPVVGETLELITAGDTFGTSRRQRYGDVYKTNILGAPTVMVYGEDAVRTVLAAEDKLVASEWPQATSVLVGPDSLNLLSGARHGAVKRALADAFSERTMRRHVPRIAAVVQEYMARWADGQQPTPGYAACQELSQAVFDAVVLGGDGGPARAAQLQEHMARLGAGFQTPPLDLPFTAYGQAVAARAAFGRMVSDSIAACRSPSSTTSAPDCAMADVVAAAAAAAAAAAKTVTSASFSYASSFSASAAEPPLLPDSLLVDNAAAAFFGNASTGPSLAKAFQHLAASPGVLEGLRREQQDVISRHGTAITADALDNMPYASAVGKELLRITPAVPAVFRIAIVDFELQGRRVPKGWRVWCHLGDSVLKYNKDTFQPERWLMSPPAAHGGAAAAATAGVCPMHGGSSGAAAAATASETGGGNGDAARPEYSLPFGSGVRTCLGRNLVMAELMVVLATLARSYEWEALNPGEEWRVVPAPAPKEGLLVKLRRRS